MQLHDRLCLSCGLEVKLQLLYMYVTVNNIVLGSTSLIYDYMIVITISDRACTLHNSTVIFEQ